MRIVNFISYLAVIHGIYYLFMGVWPLLDMNSFLAITGEKTDIWLVRTVSVLVSAIGLGLIIARIKHLVSLPIAIICLISTAGLTVIDTVNVLTERIPAIYIADAFIETFLFTGWLISLFKKHRHHLHHRSTEQNPYV